MREKIFAVPKNPAKFGELVFKVDWNEWILQELIFAVTLSDVKMIFTSEHCSFTLKSHVCLIIHTLHTYKKPLFEHLINQPGSLGTTCMKKSTWNILLLGDMWRNIQITYERRVLELGLSQYISRELNLPILRKNYETLKLFTLENFWH